MIFLALFSVALMSSFAVVTKLRWKYTFLLQRLGFSIPQDVSVIGFDNQSIISQRVYPKLTTVELPYRNMVLKGYDLIVSEDSHSICNVAISCDPIIRGSLK
jgi:LacI family transcriptional regulator